MKKTNNKYFDNAFKNAGNIKTNANANTCLKDNHADTHAFTNTNNNTKREDKFANAQIKNSRNVNIVHMDAKVLIYAWLISFLSVLFLACAGYYILDNKIQRTDNKVNALAYGLLESAENAD